MTGTQLSATVERGIDRSVIAESIAATIGIALITGALLANLGWFERHFLPPFFTTRQEYIEATWAARLVTGVLGATLLFAVRPRIGRLIASMPLLAFLA